MPVANAEKSAADLVIGGTGMGSISASFTFDAVSLPLATTQADRLDPRDPAESQTTRTYQSRARSRAADAERPVTGRLPDEQPRCFEISTAKAFGPAPRLDGCEGTLTWYRAGNWCCGRPEHRRADRVPWQEPPQVTPAPDKPGRLSGEPYLRA